MVRSAIGLSSKVSPKASSRIALRKHRLWPSREVRLPPGGPPPAESDRAPLLPAGTLTARELIAMARAARIGREG